MCFLRVRLPDHGFVYLIDSTDVINLSLELEIIQLCNCTSVACQLLSYGLFPCAPTTPTLAVDLNVLDFAQGLFVNAAPNTTAWCDTLEGFLSARNFKLTTRVRLIFSVPCLTDSDIIGIYNRTPYVNDLAMHYDGMRI